jgi:hypothetical protein
MVEVVVAVASVVVILLVAYEYRLAHVDTRSRRN